MEGRNGWLAAALLVGLSLLHITNGEVKCQNGWTEGYGKCWKFFPVHMTFDDAEALCQSYGGGHLAIGKDFHFKAALIAKVVQMSSNPVNTWWQGVFRERGRVSVTLVDGGTLDPEIGFFDNGQVNPGPSTKRECQVMRGNPDSYLYPNVYGTAFESCFSRLPFVCMHNSCPSGQLQCANGRCVPPANICDGIDDCLDFTDERHCPGRKTWTYNDGSVVGSFSALNYGGYETYRWSIEVQFGKGIELKFTQLKTEKDADVLEVWCGGRSLEKSQLIVRLSGINNPTATYRCPFPFMTITFYTDYLVSFAGVDAEWKAVNLPSVPTELSATAAAQILLLEPIQGGERLRWIIDSGNQWKIITLKRIRLQLPRGAYLMVVDGEDFNADTLFRYRSGHEYEWINAPYIQSSQRYMLIYLWTPIAEPSGKMEFEYTNECSVTLEGTAFILKSPGFGISNYPNAITCRYNVESGTTQTLIYDIKMARINGTDTMTIFEGNNSTGLVIYNSSSPGSTKSSSSTNLFVEFLSSGGQPDRGFSIAISAGCKMPAFNAVTMSGISVPPSYQLGSRIRIKCPAGYYFAQEEFKHLIATNWDVTIRCDASGWDVRSTPNCEPVHCGLPPEVEGGYIAQSATNNLTYGGTIKYLCQSGSGFMGTDSVTCQINGEWSIPTPVCANGNSATHCSVLPTTVPNGGRQKEHSPPGATGDNERGTIFKYFCDQGYRLTGDGDADPFRLCEGGTWRVSSTPPTCVQITCHVELAHFPLRPSGWPASASITVGRNLSVSCRSGYEIKGDPTMTCQQNGNFDKIPVCVDLNECTPSSPPCTNADCTNTIGSFTCHCKKGYEPTNSATVCQDINECANRNDWPCHPHPIGACRNVIGSYNCSCPDLKYELFMAPMTNGFTVPPSETKDHPNNTYRNMHTCVKKTCPYTMEPSRQNLRPQAVYHIDDTIQFECILGYSTLSTPESTCTINGWSPPLPTCTSATCALRPDTSQPPSVRPTFKDAGGTVITSLQYGKTVTITCSNSRSTIISLTRTCKYLQGTNTYGINPDASDNDQPFACPVDTCPDYTKFPVGNGKLTYVSGVENQYGSLYSVACNTGSRVTGNTSLPSNHVMCGDNGKWIAGDINCPAAQCSNPLTVPKTTQMIENRYFQGSKVSYECSAGYDLLPTAFSTTCQSSLSWSPTPVSGIPRCRWNKKPILTGCPATTPRQTIALYGIPSIATVTATAEDNKTTMVDVRFTRQSILFHYIEGKPLVASIQVTHKATTADPLSPLTDTCTYTISVEELVPPEIVCPLSSVYYADSSSPAIMNVTDMGHAITTTAQANISYSPTTFTTSAPSVIKVTATASIQYGSGSTSQSLTTSCDYTIQTASSCSGQTLTAPNTFTNVSCTSGTCNFRCVQDAYFRETGSTSTSTSKIITCQSSGQWSPAGPLPACVQSVAGRYAVTANLSYEDATTTNAPIQMTCLPTYEAAFKGIVNTFTDADCKDFYNVNPIIDVTTVTVSNTVTNRLVFSFTIELHRISATTPIIVTACRGSLDSGLKIKNRPEYLERITAANCPDLKKTSPSTNPPGTTSVSQAVFACSPSQIKLSSNKCVPCGPGQYISGSGSTCADCGQGTYSTGGGTVTCTPCQTGTSTKQAGSTSSTDCTGTCESQQTSIGFYGVSASGVPPCNECRRNTYLNSTLPSTLCNLCDPDTSTESSGSLAATDCKAQCPAGMYSPTGYMFSSLPCVPCPHGLYKPNAGAGKCMSCSNGFTTPSTGSISQGNCTSTPTCSPSCNNNGVCAIAGNIPYCNCQVGWSGPTCDVQENTCAIERCGFGGTCTNTRGTAPGYTCACAPNFTGSKCETNMHCDNNPCGSNGKCQTTEATPFYKCICNDAASGPTCSSLPNPCAPSMPDACAPQNMSACTNSQPTPVRKTCTCKPGYTGARCELPIDECSSNPCQNGGTCMDKVNGYMCSCNSYYDGLHCENHVTNCAVVNANCLGGDCIINHRTGQELCACSGYLSPVSHGTTVPWWASFTNVSTQCMHTNVCGLKALNLCQNGATCKNTGRQGDGYECQCPQGYIGKHCQINVDDCDPNPCVNGGKCTDDINNFKCNCSGTGYTGSVCNDAVNECANNDCDPSGLQQCEEDTPVVGQFNCKCKPGYAGKRCQIKIDECASSPCQHGGTCKDEINAYTCTCKAGWSGADCEELIPKCNPSPCASGAPCTSLTGISHCHCPPNTYGATCNGISNMCNDVINVCNTGGICSLTNQQSVMCECSQNRTGEFCELVRQPCKTGRECGNKGICSVPELDKFSCECRDGTSGPTCTSAQSSCIGISCSNGGACIPSPEGAFCQCTSNFAGPTCGKVLDRNYDIRFHDEEATASSRYPFQFKSSNFSIGAWVRYETSPCEPSPTGDFLALYGTKFPDSDTSDRSMDKFPILRMDQEKVVVYPRQIRQSHIPSMVPYNQGNDNMNISTGDWLYMLSTYNDSSKMLTVYANGIRIGEMMVPGPQVYKYGWVVLGSQKDVIEDRPFHGFQGYVSQAMVWNRPLTSRDNAKLTSNPPSNQPGTSDLDADLRVGLISDWSHWILGRGSQTVSPSQAGPTTPSGAPKQCRPVFNKCPTRPITQLGVNRLTVITWPDLDVQNAISVQCTYQSGDVFTLGLYTNICVAKNNEGLSATCVFDIAVRTLNCPDPTISDTSTSLSCSTKMYPTATPFNQRICKPKCSNAMASVAQPNSYMCDPMGSFDVGDITSPGTIPACGAMVPNGVRYNVTISATYPGIANCELVRSINGISKGVLDNIKMLSRLTNAIGSSVNPICPNDPNCAEVVLVEECIQPPRRARRLLVQGSSTITRIVLKLNNTLANLLYQPGGGRPTLSFPNARDLLQTLFIDQKLADVPTIDGAMADPFSLRFDVTPVCAMGQGLLNNNCITCAPGTYAPPTRAPCMICPKGEYQDIAGQTKCKPCATGQTTDQPGAASSSKCIDRCLKGNYYDLDDFRCKSCPIGTYMNEEGKSRACKPCKASQTTRSIGSESAGDCLATCPDGQELGPGQCQLCKSGTYRKQGIQDSCKSCPAGFKTPSNGAVTQAQCTVPNCLAGSMISGLLCVPCPIGFWQDKPDQESCNPCGANKITRQSGTQLESKCELDCPPGTELSDPNKCLPCPRGYWKDNSTLPMHCTPCDPGFTTMTTGASSKLQCNIPACNLGEYLDQNSCKNCSADHYQNNPLSNSCKPCPIGKGTGGKTGASHESECLANCSAGYADLGGGHCLPCPLGTFKPIADTSNCTECPTNKTTAGTGSINQQACDRDRCDPGNYLDGLVCKPCPKGFYQEKPRQAKCDRCRTGTTTFKPGTALALGCILNCTDGHEYDSVLRKCIPCKQGFYRTQGDEDVCERCPAGNTTRGPGSLTIEDCTFKNCSAGYFWNKTSEICVKCDFGTYQELDYAEVCKPCPFSQTTFLKGATSKGDCMLMCPAGWQWNKTDEICKKCPRGHFRTTEGGPWCLQCPTRKTTDHEGAKNMDECTRNICPAGSYDGGNGPCLFCPRGTYQPKASQDKCRLCTYPLTTLRRGAINETECKVGPTCDPECLASSAGGECIQTSKGYQCSCRPGWQGKYPACRHPCADGVLCKDNQDCYVNEKGKAFCKCRDNSVNCKDAFQGDQSSSMVVVASAIGGAVAFLLILCIVCVACGGCNRCMARGPGQYKKQYNNGSPASSSIHGFTTTGEPFYNDPNIATNFTSPVMRYQENYQVGSTLGSFSLGSNTKQPTVIRIAGSQLNQPVPAESIVNGDINYGYAGYQYADLDLNADPSSPYVFHEDTNEQVQLNGISTASNGVMNFT